MAPLMDSTPPSSSTPSASEVTTMRLENTMKTMLKPGSFLVLASLVACGGGGSSSNSGGTPSNPNAATKLVYTNPTPTAGQWALMKDAASTDTHLVLDLVSPTD